MVSDGVSERSGPKGLKVCLRFRVLGLGCRFMTQGLIGLCCFTKAEVLTQYRVGSLYQEVLMWLV